MNGKNIILWLLGLCLGTAVSAQTAGVDTSTVYKKRVLESSTLDILGSYYTQDGSHAAVSGGTGDESLTDIHPIIVLSMPLNEDDILTIDAGISAYSSASSSNINPFDGGNDANPFQASSGASSSDTWTNINAAYSHSSDDRNQIWSAHASMSTEYDYSSIGAGASFTQLLNKKNTEFSISGNVLLDTWKLIYPIELRPFLTGSGLNGSLFNQYMVTGNPDYSPSFRPILDKGRNSFSLGLGFSQILSRRIQASVNVDLVRQEGQLSTPFQRVYFSDVEDSFIEDFHLADDIERLPSSRSKLALGTRLNMYVNQHVVIRTLYRYYSDDWGILSHTATVTLPVKIGSKLTFYPSYRYYIQSASDYFAAYNEHLSTEEFYTSDYDLSGFTANRYGFGIRYSDVLRNFKIGSWGLDGAGLTYHFYERNTDFKASTIAFELNFTQE